MNRKGTAWWRVLAVLAALGLLAAGCGDDSGDNEQTSDQSLLDDETPTDEGDEPEDSAKPTYGGSVTIGLEAESNMWTPGQGSFAGAGLTVAMAVFDPLVAITQEGEYEGFLAESIEPNDDLTQWTLTLRDGVEFHDGTPLDAEAIKWNMETLHLVEGSRTAGALADAGLQSVEVVDPSTVIYHLDDSNAAFPDLLRSAAGWPVSPTAYQADPDGFGELPVGTGPFKMTEWRRDDRAVTVRNDNYWFTAENGDQLPYLDEVIFRPIPDEDSRVQSLASGDLNMMQTMRGSTVKRVMELEDGGGFLTNLHAGNESNGAIFNVLEAPLDDVRVRQALVMATDSREVQAVLGDDGLVEPSSGFFSLDSPWYSAEAAAAYPTQGGVPDVEAAKALIEEYRADPERSDGKAPGSPINLEYNCPPDPSLALVSQLQQSQWAAIGVETKLNTVEQGPHIENAVGTPDTDPPFRGNFIVNCWRAGGGTGDPLTALQAYFGEVATTPGNFTNYTNPEIDELLEELRTNANFADRYAAVERIGIIVAEEVPMLWVSSTATAVGYANNIHGVTDWKLPSGAMGSGTPGATVRFHQIFIEE